MAIAYIGLGSNLGRKKANIRRAIKLLGEKKDVKILKVSSLYETEPVGYVKQDWFVNAVLKAETNLTPRQLLAVLKEIEKQLKRKKAFLKWGPRTIDLDILFYNNLKLKTKDLVIPHPEMHKRAFVLIPLMELEPNFIHPTKRKSILELLANLKRTKKVKKLS
ncbi:2-amino-4-hydroxy-6-hydroxymethyldihydropteridine diphosphokinase [bacterium]|nr:2-amino-4-hydroxy-6-hydroxymethyldihydropteridine diphosphokinase [bacterium]MBU4560688.1 2-amino-4-hydroxy-6-hydroxymethyldihydropteridine diphosphokinase [bacterium]MCG2676084.1 2-amino-4-hydroxy-6-hydroxymethyldihydropteridine diphosphokinase [bacterium]MCG2677002.1 2-amino-4-hydroxy-6-hydroxymethyldihydropteridine diphosphokinase [bacterium]